MTSIANWLSDGTHIWAISQSMSGGRTLFKMRVSDGATVGRYPVPDSRTRGLVFDGTHIWVASGETLLKMRASDGAMVDSYDASPGGFDDYTELVFDGTHIWAGPAGHGHILKIRPSDGAVLETFTPSPIRGRSMMFDGTYVWGNGYRERDRQDENWRIRPSDGQITNFPTSLTNRLVDMMVSDGSDIWGAVMFYQGKVQRFRASDGELVDHFKLVDWGDLFSPSAAEWASHTPNSIVFDGSHIWVLDSWPDILVRIRASDGQIVGKYPIGAKGEAYLADPTGPWNANADKLGAPINKVPESPKGAMIFDGTHLWVWTTKYDPSPIRLEFFKIRAFDSPC